MNKRVILGLSRITLATLTVLFVGQSQALASAETTETGQFESQGFAGEVFVVLSDTTYADKLQSSQNTEVANTESYVASTSVATATTTSYTLTNGNTAGEVGTAAAAQMAAATGVSQETWEYIIARESNGNASVTSSSGASGLFQTMPGWGSTATVEDQIQSAINAYNAQGLSAWGLQ